MNKHSKQPASVLAKVAGTMQRMGIEGLPRNYELVYEAMSGTRPDLTRAFLALGNDRSQKALDELGRKYLPHHHEHEVLNRSNATVRDELGSFMRLVRQETSSLKHFGSLLDETSRKLAGERAATPVIGEAVRTIAAATARKAAEGHEMADEVAEQSSRLERVAGDLDAFEKLKYLDPLTGFANRRAFNREINSLFNGPNGPNLTGIALCDIDNFATINERHDAIVGDRFIRHVARLIEQQIDSGVLVARTGGGQFGFIFRSADAARILRTADLIRTATAMSPLTDDKSGISTGLVTLSFGICMVEWAVSAGALIEHAAEALAKAKAGGRNRAEVYAPPVPPARAGNDWILYRR